MKQLLAILADLANGIFATALAGVLTGTEIMWWHFPIGIILAMCPDIDAIPELWRRGRVGSSAAHMVDHRTFVHLPFLFGLVGILLIYLMAPFWGWLFIFATILHFINDFYGTGWGIPVFWPFSRRRYKLLGRRVNRLKYQLVESGEWNNLSTDERRLRLIVSWKEEELPAYIVRWGMDDWVDVVYLRLNWISGTEYALFMLSLLVLYSSLV